jgi:FkbM family methyltransferase
MDRESMMRRLWRLPPFRSLGVRRSIWNARNRVAGRRRSLFERFGSDRYSHPALHGLDRKLADRLPQRGGYFVEAGAYDGFIQSNTYWLERFRGWRGILVEPMPTYHAELRRERPQATIVHAALVPAGHEGPTVRMQFGDLMSSVHGSHGDAEAERQWAALGLAVGWRDGYEADVPARTLTSILDEHRAPEVDLLSLDVEGFEPQALRGIDFERHAPRWILVEAHDLEEGRVPIEEVLEDRYVLDGQLSPLDLLYRRRDVSTSRAS